MHVITKVAFSRYNDEVTLDWILPLNSQQYNFLWQRKECRSLSQARVFWNSTLVEEKKSKKHLNPGFKGMFSGVKEDCRVGSSKNWSLHQNKD